jgi:hypothetical protein
MQLSIAAWLILPLESLPALAAQALKAASNAALSGGAEAEVLVAVVSAKALPKLRQQNSTHRLGSFRMIFSFS